MPLSPPIPRQPPGKTFLVASCLLGLAALVQIGALTWAVVKKPAVELAESEPLPVPQFIPPAQLEALANAELIPSTPTRSPAGPAATLSAAPTPSPATTPAATAPIVPPPKPVPVLDSLAGEKPPQTRYQELILQGRTLRERGDMASAFTKLREAQTLEPTNPQGFAEIAVTYEKMGLSEKAAEQWKRILQMGEAAGSYFIAADARLKQSQALAMMAAQSQAAKVDPAATANPNAILAIDRITSQESVDPTASRKFLLRVPLKLRVPGKVDVRDVAVHVLFYDQIDGKSIVQTSANVSSRWASSPPDWADSDTEVLEVEYSQPRPDPRENGREDRKYFGYIVRLYYKSALQDSRADPLRLAAQFSVPQTLEKDPP